MAIHYGGRPTAWVVLTLKPGTETILSRQRTHRDVSILLNSQKARRDVRRFVTVISLRGRR